MNENRCAQAELSSAAWPEVQRVLQGLNQGAPVEELAPTPMLSSMPQDLNVQVGCLKVWPGA